MEIIDLLKKYFNRTITKKEFDILDVWINSSEENKEEFKKMVKVNHLSKLLLEYENEGTSCQTTTQKKYKQLILKRRLIKTAVSVAAILVVSLLTHTIIQNIEDPLKNTTTIVANNISKNVVLTVYDYDNIQEKQDSLTILKQIEIQKSNDTKTNVPKLDTVNKIKILSVKVPSTLNYMITLSDGTKVTINSDSELIYPSKFVGGEREVFIEGEAFFEVAKDAKHPFIVKTHNSSVKVLGTVFNINSYKDSQISTTTLVSGKVELAVANDIVILNPNQKAIINRASSNITDVRSCNVSRDIAWIDGKYYFDSESLENILRVLSRWYDVSFTFSNNSINNMTFSGVIDKKIPIDKVMDMLIETVNFDYVINDNNNIEIICN